MSFAEIIAVKGRRVWDSRGRPTVEAEVTLASGDVGRAIAPAGASRGAAEAVELRDGGTALAGFGVERAVANVAVCGEALVGHDATDLPAIDRTLIDPAEPAILEDLVVAAHNDAKGKVEARMAEEMQALTGGLGLPPGFKLPF